MCYVSFDRCMLLFTSTMAYCEIEVTVLLIVHGIEGVKDSDANLVLRLSGPLELDFYGKLFIREQQKMMNYEL